MSEKRVFVAQRWPANIRQVVQVVLELDGAGSFALVLSTASSDWGDRHERTERFTGRYEQRPDAVECQATRRATRMRGADHEQGTKADESTDGAVDRKFSFASKPGGLVCPVDHEGLGGVLMSASLTPHAGVFA